MYRSRVRSSGENVRYPDSVRSGERSPSDSRKRILEMLMSGKSGASVARTAPIVNEPGVAAGLTRGGLLGGTGIEDQSELADLDLVTSLQRGLVDPFPVDVRAVQRADVTDQEDVTFAAKGRMLAGYGDVIKEDVTIRVTPRADLVGVEQESCAGIGATKDHQQRRAVTQRIDRCLVLGRQGAIDLNIGIGQRLGGNSYAGQAHRGRVVPSPLSLLGLFVRHDVSACFRCRVIGQPGAGQVRRARYATMSSSEAASPASVTFTSYIHPSP